MRKYLIKILNWLVYREYRPEYGRADKRLVEEWLYKSFGDQGAMGYLQTEELKILRNLARGLNQEAYWKELGKREQVSLLMNAFERAAELRKAAQAKAEADEAKKRKAGGDNEQASDGNGSGN
jgi:hypothetical protein